MQILNWLIIISITKFYERDVWYYGNIDTVFIIA